MDEFAGGSEVLKTSPGDDLVLTNAGYCAACGTWDSHGLTCAACGYDFTSEGSEPAADETV